MKFALFRNIEFEWAAGGRLRFPNVWCIVRKDKRTRERTNSGNLRAKVNATGPRNKTGWINPAAYSLGRPGKWLWSRELGWKGRERVDKSNAWPAASGRKKRSFRRVVNWTRSRALWHKITGILLCRWRQRSCNYTTTDDYAAVFATIADPSLKRISLRVVLEKDAPSRFRSQPRSV